ncbi:MAG: CARDB domain-containing protein, partial [Methermicoccaceae archaeon]
PYVENIEGDYWVMYWVNYTYAPVGMGDYNLNGGEYLLFGTSTAYPVYPLIIPPVGDVEVGVPFDVFVGFVNTSWGDPILPMEEGYILPRVEPAPFADVYVNGTYYGTTDASGTVQMQLNEGNYILNADGPRYIASEEVPLTVSSPSNSLTLTPDSSEAAAGGSVNLNVTANFTTPVYSIDCVVKYDPSVLTLVNNTPGSYLGTIGENADALVFVNKIDNTNGIAELVITRIVNESSGKDLMVNGSGTFSTLTFNVDNNATGNTVVSIINSNNTTALTLQGTPSTPVVIPNVYLGKSVVSVLHHPTIIVTSPVEGALIKSSSLTTNFSVINTTGVRYVSLKLDSKSPVLLSPTATNYTFTGLTDGAHTLVATLIDSSLQPLAYTGAMRTVNFTVDAHAPTLTITSPVNGTYYTTDTVQLHVVASENVTAYYTWYTAGLLGGTEESSAGVSLPAPTLLGTGTEFTANLTLGDGTHTVIVTAQDGAGWSVMKNVTFTIDTASPTITIHLPVEGGLYSAPQLVANSSEPSTMSYSLDGGVNVTPVAGITTSLVVDLTPIADGNHTITVYARDRAGNTASEMVNFTSDATPPVITIISPTATTYNTPNIVLNATFNEPVYVRYDFDGVTSPWSLSLVNELNRSFIAGVGSHTITVYARDEVGNSASKKVDFTVDLPKSDLIVRVEGEVITGTNLSVPKGANVRITANVTNIGEGPSSATTTALYADSKRLADRAIPSLKPNESTEVSLTWVALRVGDFNMSAVVDPSNNVNETDENNNTDSFIAAVRGNLNLVLTGSMSSPTELNQPYTVSVQIKAVDAPATTNVDMNLTNVGSVMLNTASVNLAPNEQKTVNLSFTPTRTGWHRISVEVNPNRTLKETSYLDNKIERWVYVSIPDLRVYINARNVMALGDSQDIWYYVSNRGGIPSGNETLSVYIEDPDGVNTTIHTETVQLGAWRGTPRHKYVFTPTKLGTYKATVYVTHNNTNDIHLDNNVVTRNIVVKEFNMSAYTMYYPYEIYEGNWLWIGVRFNSTAPTTVNATITLPDGLYTHNPTKTNKYTYGGKYNTLWWKVKAVEAGTYNFSVVIEAHGKTTSIASNNTTWGPSPWGNV